MIYSVILSINILFCIITLRLKQSQLSRIHDIGYIDILVMMIKYQGQGDWLLQQLCIKRLLPYFFIVGQCKVPLVALPRDVSAPACRGQRRPSLWCICLQTQGTMSLPISSGSRGQERSEKWV